MIIRLDSRYEAKLLKNGLKNIELFHLSKIFQATIENRVFFRATRDFFDYLIQHHNSYFSEPVRGYLSDMYENYSTLIGDTNGIKVLINISENGTNTFKNLPKELSPSLYCEHSTDSDFYLYVFNTKYGEKDNIYLLPRDFGGCNVDCIKTLKKTKAIFLSIFDSDKKYPKAQRGGTCRTLAKLFNNSPTYMECYTLLVHEKENMIPTTFLKPPHASQKKMLEIIGKSNDDIKDYFDIKSGLRKKDHDRWSSNVLLKNVQYPVFDEMDKNHFCVAVTNDDDKYFGGIGDKEIEKIITNRVTYSNIIDHLTMRQKADWKNIFSLINKFGFRYSKITN